MHMEDVNMNQDPKDIIKTNLTGFSPEEQVRYAKELINSGFGIMVSELLDEFHFDAKDEVSDLLIDNLK